MDYLEKIVEVYQKEESNFINQYSLETVKTTALYMFYHYFNADVTKLEELNSTFCFLTGDIGDIIAINNSYYEENAIDFITVLPASIMKSIEKINFEDIFSNYMKKINKTVADIICRNTNEENERCVKKYEEFDFDDNTVYYIKILCNYSVPIEKKLWYQKEAAEYSVSNNRVKFEILFEDDILEEVSDVECPKDSVQSGSLQLYENSSIAYFGEEKSFLGFVSANSLKENFYKYSTHGLFASNLRYYVKSAKIDNKITKTIMEQPENFCYYNNGIIITCDDYKIYDDRIYLKKFSIVNGGQTTNLIGRTNFENDFAVMCKVIKNKYSKIEDKVNFLSEVAEASNTQKPIKAKDLIANRPEQRLLKIQFEKAGMFLQIKRGEKISKEIYSEPWQNATNDNVAQMINSCIYQMPGASKNSKSKLLENDNLYDKIFKPTYNSNFLVSLQHLKIGFNNWVKKLKKEEKYGSSKLGIAKNGDLLILATIGLIYKILLNNNLKYELKNIDFEELNYSNDRLRFLISQNDIGELNLLSSELVLKLGKRTFFDLFNILMEEFLVDAYEAFKRKYPTYSYGNFVKSDMYYFNYVVPLIVKKFCNDDFEYDLSAMLDMSTATSVVLDSNEIFDKYKPGLEEELLEYRKRIFKESNGEIKAYEVFKNIQLVGILKYIPRTTEELKTKIKFSNEQCEKYGEAILKIVSKYMNSQEFM